jgi:hypothetical protein
MNSWLIVALLFAFGALLSIIIIATSLSNVDFSLDNSGWNGYSWLHELGAQQIYTLEALPSSTNNSVLIIPSPSREPERSEIDLIKAFLLSGGTLIIANDYGYGNTWLRALDICEAFLSSPILDTVLFDSDIYLPKALGYNHTVSLNIAVPINTSCIADKNAIVLLRTSMFSFIDENSNKQKDENELEGPFVVAVMFNYGEGRLVLLGDPSIMINYMIEREGNREFAKWLLHSKQVYIYAGALDETTLIKAKSSLSKVHNLLLSPELKYTLGLSLVIILTTLTSRLLFLYGKREKTPSVPDFIGLSEKELLMLRKDLREGEKHE